MSPLCRIGYAIAAATYLILSDLVARGTFREDLFYRLNVVKIELPPLLRRREDMIRTKHLSREILNRTENRNDAAINSPSSHLDAAEKKAIVNALQRHNANRGKTAAFLGINKSTLWRKMKKYNIE
jgi:transcriptional regulator with PAS, ATPase and Fis domain